MFPLPRVTQKLFEEFAPVFRKRTAKRMQWLVLGAIVLRGRRTFTRILRLLCGLVPGHFLKFYRLFSRPRWSSWKAGRILARLIIESAPLGEPIVVQCDTTVSEHPGRCVYGKDKHRDAVRSSHSYTAWRWGHKRVVLAVALSILVARDGAICETVSETTGFCRTLLSQCRFVRSAASVFGQRPSTGQRSKATEARTGRGRWHAVLEDPRRLVRWRAAASRHPFWTRPLVSSRGRSGSYPLGVRRRSRRNPPARLFLQYRPDAGAKADRGVLHFAVEHRNDLSGSACPLGIRNNASLVSSGSRTCRAVVVGTVQPCDPERLTRG